VLEAMALGRTVVAMDDPQADHLVDGVTALVAQERDAREWAALVSRALGDRELVGRVGAEASARTVARFGSATCAEHLATACAHALRGPSIPFPGPDAG
jgi:glycosyltransferase involved in cell wall biosynthesis